MTAAESEYEPVSDYEFEGAVSDYEARSEFDDTDEWEKDKSISKRSARVGDTTVCPLSFTVGKGVFSVSSFARRALRVARCALRVACRMIKAKMHSRRRKFCSLKAVW